MMSSHVVFCHDVACSHGSVATRAHCMTKHVQHVINLASEMSILLEIIDKDGAISSMMQCSLVSCLCKITSALLVKHQSWTLSF